MRKKLLKTLMAVCVASFAFAIASCDLGTEETSSEPSLAFELREDSYAVVGIGTYDKGNLEIPSEYNGKPVTVIGASAFEKNGEIGTVVIPNSVTVIEENAFANCSNLTKVELGGKVTDIEANAFTYCRKIKEVKGFDSVIAVGASAFEWCSSLKKVEFTDELQMISEKAFEECWALKTVTVGKSLEAIGPRAFYDCTSLQGFTIPDGAKTDIASEAFYGCEAMDYVYLGNDVVGIGKSAFQSCAMLRDIVLGDGIISIGESAFEACRKMHQITFGTNLREIGKGAFNKCQRLREVYNRSALTINVGEKNDEGTINGNLGRYIYYVRTEGQPTRISKDENGLIYYTEGNKKELISVELKDNVELVVPDDVTDIGSYACYNEQNITGVVIGDGCKTIGYRAFCNSYRIGNVILGKNVEKIADEAFYHNVYIDWVVVGNKLTKVGEKAFAQKVVAEEEEEETIPATYKFVYFMGTEKEWDDIRYGSVFADGVNEPLLAISVTVAYYTEEEPTESGKYWHYVDGVPTMWD